MRRGSFLVEAIRHMASSDMLVIFTPKSTKFLGGGCSGLFDFANKDFYCSLEDDQWFASFIHEYCHFLQYLDGKFKEMDFMDQVWDFIAGKIELSPYKYNKYITKIMELEWDCEKRALELIADKKLDLDSELYAQQANMYIWFYIFVKKYKSWVSPTVFNDVELLNQMPKTLRNFDYYLNTKNLGKDCQKKFKEMFKEPK